MFEQTTGVKSLIVQTRVRESMCKLTLGRFPARYREPRRSRGKPSSLKAFDAYLRGRLIPRFGDMRTV